MKQNATIALGATAILKGREGNLHNGATVAEKRPDVFLLGVVVHTKHADAKRLLHFHFFVVCASVIVAIVLALVARILVGLLGQGRIAELQVVAIRTSALGVELAAFSFLLPIDAIFLGRGPPALLLTSALFLLLLCWEHIMREGTAITFCALALLLEGETFLLLVPFSFG